MIVAGGSLVLHIWFELSPGLESLCFGALAGATAWFTMRHYGRELGESDARYERVAENAADVIFRIRVRPDVRLEYASAAFERITGHAPEDITQRRGFAASLIHPEDREAALAAFRNARSEAFSLPALRLATKDGRYLWMETRCVPVADESGTVVAVEGIARDVTAARAAEEALRASESRFRLLVDGVDAIFWEGTPDPPSVTFVSHGAEPKLGYPAARWLGSFDFWATLLHPDDRESTLASFSAAIARGVDHTLTYRMVARDGRVFWFEDVVRVETDASGRAVRLTGVMVDVTARMRIQEDLERELAVSAGLLNLKKRLLGASSLEEICQATLEQACALTRSPFGFVAEREPETGELVALAVTPGICAGMPGPHRFGLRPGGGLLSSVAERLEPVLSNDVGHDPRAAGGFPPGHARIDRVLSVPALRGEELVGQIAVANASEDYDEHDVKVMQLLAPNVALAITRLRAQQALEGSRAQLQAIIESAMDAIVSVDEEGRLVVFNSAAESMFGVCASDAIGSRLDRFIPERFRYAHAEHVRRGATGRAVVESGIGLREDGTEFPLEASVSTVRLGDRHLSTAILRDLTERRRAEEEQMHLQRAVMQSSDDWRRTFDAMPSAVVVLDGSGRVERLNREACGALGADYTDFVGRPLSRVAPGEPWRTALGLASGGSATARQRVLDEVSGRWFSVAATRVPPRVPGEPRTIVVADDVTPLVNLELSMGRAEKMAAMGALTAGVAHEVRNPLFAIAASVDALGAMLTDRPKVAHLLKLMREQAARMNQLMHELLAYGRPLPKQSYADVPVEPLLERSTRACAAIASAAGVSIARDGETASVVRGDASRLEEVVTNLLENAVQHSRAGSEVTLSVVEPAADSVRISVADRGPGFRSEDLPKVFEPFFSRRAGGTGLGLSIVQRITEQHGGRVTIENRSEGGARVTVDLPTVAVRQVPADAGP